MQGGCIGDRQLGGEGRDVLGRRLAKREEWTALAAVLLNLDERLTRE
ncbi:MAG: hypothetical protein ACPGR8_11505 [Limisphaerales bacterium]